MRTKREKVANMVLGRQFEVIITLFLLIVIASTLLKEVQSTLTGVLILLILLVFVVKAIIRL